MSAFLGLYKRFIGLLTLCKPFPKALHCCGLAISMPCHRAQAPQAQAGYTKGHPQQKASSKKYTGTVSDRLDPHKVQRSSSFVLLRIPAPCWSTLEPLLLLCRSCSCILHAAAHCMAEGLCCMLLLHLISMHAVATDNVNAAGCSVQLLQRSALCTTCTLNSSLPILQHSS